MRETSWSRLLSGVEKFFFFQEREESVCRPRCICPVHTSRALFQPRIRIGCFRNRILLFRLDFHPHAWNNSRPITTSYLNLPRGLLLLFSFSFFLLQTDSLFHPFVETVRGKRVLKRHCFNRIYIYSLFPPLWGNSCYLRKDLTMRLVKIIFGATVNWIEGEGRRYLSFAWYFEEEDHIFTRC